MQLSLLEFISKWLIFVPLKEIGAPRPLSVSSVKLARSLIQLLSKQRKICSIGSAAASMQEAFVILDACDESLEAESRLYLSTASAQETDAIAANGYVLFTVDKRSCKDERPKKDSIAHIRKYRLHSALRKEQSMERVSLSRSAVLSSEYSGANDCSSTVLQLIPWLL
ncbi:uncharacterized protein PHALS_03272 [Plasmopara halstedii]|uniref:Uncharacterized protein n=1 Tax=Plasmopara halstedii TaxID=4781 RepID=A0A0P1AXY5_PLAHL|nr:uncharacterized protein PHALS_03272 [Plasmopara halstedii]CEG46665.1 hypothetical protein PHALS_03272 [Plasmopara halstedii]|eukprot:XP_024583034.1 hypothetical protein PHALS_03272 [Plasmopara halstedii]